MSSIPNQMFADAHADFEGVASRYSPVLFRIALRRLRNVEDAEDAVQEALLSAYKHIEQFEGRSQLSSWLTRIVINTAGMKLRRRWPQEVVSLDESPKESETTFANQLVDPRPNPETICAQTELEEMLSSAIAQISPKLRVAFQMRELAGLSTRETADALNVKTTTLKSRVKRARAALGSYFDEAGGAPIVDGSRSLAANQSAHSRYRRNFRKRRAGFAFAKTKAPCVEFVPADRAEAPVS